MKDSKCTVPLIGVVVLILVLINLVSANNNINDDEGSDCFVKWVHGYRLASGRPQKILHSVSLEICKQECASTVGCAAFAFGSTRAQQPNSTICELAINSRLWSSSRRPPSSSSSISTLPQQRSFPRFFRDGRSVAGDDNKKDNGTTGGAPTITISDLDRNPTYDVYIENPNADDPCYKRDALYESSYPAVHNQIGGGGPSGISGGLGGGHHHHNQLGGIGGGGVGTAGHLNGVPIDCFYRLMSGKRLVKTHTLRAISVNSLQECQGACIHERSFNCRSISYRYMPSTGYSYPVSNCEMSSYYMQSGTISSSYSKLDFVEDYDYDYFCAVVVRRGGRVSTTLIKSSHHTITSSQCEHLCATSLFRCRAFAFRHTTRGRDPLSHHTANYPSSSPPISPTRDIPPPADHSCLLYDTDLMRLPSYNIEPDQDFDLFEMGRLMGAECVLYEQFLNRRPGYYNPGPVTSTVAYPAENRDYYGGGGGVAGGIGGGDRGYFDSRNTQHQQHGQHGGMMMGGGDSHHRVDQHPHGTGMNYLINRDHDNRRGGSNMAHQHHHQSPPSTLETGLMVGGGGGGSYDNRFENRPMDRENPAAGVHARPPPIDSSGGFSNSSSSSSSGGGEHSSGGTPYYDKGKESCLRLYRQDSYLLPEVSRATFPVKTLEECRIECIRSIEVLRFPCRAMAFRHTSHVHHSSSLVDRVPGGTCQLSDNDPREPDLIPSRDRYEGAVTFLYEDREPGCARGGGGAAVGSNYYDSNSRGRYPFGYVDYYNQNRNAYNPLYHSTAYNRYENRYPPSASTLPSYPPASNRYYDHQYNSDRRWSTTSSAAPPNYNAHYWDYHNRYGGSNRYNMYAPGGGDRGGGAPGGGSSYNSEQYPSGQGGTTVNGERCMRGCRLNRDAGFYYCQIDEQGAWDFCCRPDHFCGYSKGLSVPWCYVGTGPSQNIWRSCEAKGTRNNPFFTREPNVAYLHDRLPPTVFSLTSTQVANLTKDNAIRLFTNNTIEEVGGEEQSEFVAKPVKNGGGSQEVIVRVSNGTAAAVGVDDNKKDSSSSSSSSKSDGKKKS